MVNFEKFIHAQVAEMKQKEFAEKPIKTLGEVILLLETQPQDNTINLDFTCENPADVGSYRGYYEDLALRYSSEFLATTVGELLGTFRLADGAVFEGYKGGDFKMHRKTLVWVAAYGDCGRMLTDITSKGKKTIIHTQEE